MQYHPPNANIIGVNITAFGRKLTLLAPSCFPAFHLKCATFFAYFGLGKNALYVLCLSSSVNQTTRQPASSSRQS